ncbi:hypothetical protein AN214_02803 [Pseudoalteromonas sp. P1-9]|uniref:hypothetical protein n=1 Tax=Pseudoalteromonas sp. P1-9 TaxID=1710354 RepID=UPI0006D60E8F|nr:hypothetical protein [Pseudoalteromonas sp. P1-9]KPV95151.1 hypothetical protein AN214_02803 [Pseudoalteromonas sp. P1-9]
METEVNRSSLFFECENFKKAYITAIKSIFEKYNTDYDVVIDIYDESFDYEEMLSINFMEDIEVLSINEEPDEGKTPINEWSDTNIYLSGFKSDFGYMADGEQGPCILNEHLLNLDNLINNSQLINSLEFFHENLYLQRVSIEDHEKKPSLMFSNFKVSHIKSIEEVGILLEPNFLFSYKLLKEGHNSPVEFDHFFAIKGKNLDLETCRKACRSYIYEANSLLDIEIFPCPNINKEYYENIQYDEDSEHTPTRELIVCEDTDRVIQLYNKALFANDEELKILFFVKVIEYVSETVVRHQITEIGRKALSSKRALKPDASFIKELQELFNENTFRKDSEAIKLTVQTCSYIRDVEAVVPEFLKNKFNKHLQKSDQEALGYLASCISATRNSIAHSKANYKKTGNELNEAHYHELIELLRVLADHSVRWFSAQSPVSRVVA